MTSNKTYSSTNRDFKTGSNWSVSTFYDSQYSAVFEIWPFLSMNPRTANSIADVSTELSFFGASVATFSFLAFAPFAGAAATAEK